jgi:hypothetical protein
MNRDQATPKSATKAFKSEFNKVFVASYVAMNNWWSPAMMQVRHRRRVVFVDGHSFHPIQEFHSSNIIS